MPEQVAEILSHWYKAIEGLQCSSQAFYTAVGQAVDRWKLPDVQVSRVAHREGGLLSAKREYLRVCRKELIVDICAAPFGPNVFFVSWWLGKMPDSFLATLPVVGWIIKHFVNPLTYYKLDTALMFQESVHAALLEILDGAIKAKGLRALSEMDRKPILTGLFSRGGLQKG
jgi:hypothetical protein